MRKWIRVLTLMLSLSSAAPSGASILISKGSNGLPGPSIPASVPTLSGVDGPLAPDADYILPYRADGIFDFSLIDLGAGITLRFDPMTQRVKLLSQGDIAIAGRIDAPGIKLELETPEQIHVTGSILAESISLSANTLLLSGELATSTLTADGEACYPACGPLTFGEIQLKAGRDISIHERGARISRVPEPATLWLIAMLLPLLALFGRKRTIPGMADIARGDHSVHSRTITCPCSKASTPQSGAASRNSFMIADSLPGFRWVIQTSGRTVKCLSSAASESGQ